MTTESENLAETPLESMRSFVFDIAPKRERLIGSTIRKYDGQQKIVENVFDSPFYYYTIHGEDFDFDKVPHIEWYLIKTFYRSTTNQMDNFYHAQENLLKRGQSLLQKELEAEELFTINAKLVNPCYTLVRGLQALGNAKATPIASLPKKSPELVRVSAKKYMEELGRNKPEEIKETLRRYIPRWLTHPIPFPEDILDEEEKAQVSEKWSNFTSRDANYLIADEKISEGAPLHMVYKIASEFEKKDESDLAYKLKTRAISEILSLETSKIDENELPFFSFIFTSAFSGFANSSFRNPFFDYTEALNETLLQTHQRYQKELDEGVDGPASKFVESIQSYFEDKFAEMLVLSVIGFALKTRKVDEIQLLKSLKKKNPSWIHKFEDAFARHPARRVMNYHEIDEVLDALKKNSPPDTSDTLEADASEMLGDEDSVSLAKSFGSSFMRRLERGDTQFAIRIELDSLSRTIDSKIISSNEAVMRFIPFKLSFSGEIESCTLDTLEKSGIPQSTFDSLKALVAQTIHEQIVQKHINDRQMASGRQIPVISEAPRQLTRAQRIERYRAEKESEQRKRKKIPMQPDIAVVVVEKEEKETSEKIERNILNLDYATITNFLQDENITSIDAERAYNKLEFILEASNTSGKMLGKKISSNNLNEKELQGEIINLRQINWVLDGGSTQIRYYLEDVKDGNFILRGIMSKKGVNQQTRYIRKILLDIVKERKRSINS